MSIFNYFQCTKTSNIVRFSLLLPYREPLRAVGFFM